jgi:hypothetical protein
MAAGAGGHGGSDKIWGPKPPQGSRNAGHVVSHGLPGAVEHLHHEHPHHVQAEGLQNMHTKAIHHPVSEGTYKGKMGA